MKLIKSDEFSPSNSCQARLCFSTAQVVATPTMPGLDFVGGLLLISYIGSKESVLTTSHAPIWIYKLIADALVDLGSNTLPTLVVQQTYVSIFRYK